MTVDLTLPDAMQAVVASPRHEAPDLICLGRAGVDLYARQIGSPLEDVASFARYIGCSSTNIACCAARQGLKTALITRVGDEDMGRFIREQLAREGVDTRLVKTDPERLTALVILGIKDRESFPLIFYRENCADMAIDAADFDADYIGKAGALLITGTHVSTDGVYRASMEALRIARAAGVRTVLDIDYRPVLWGLTGRGDGETRYVRNDRVSEHLQGILGQFDLIVGTEEEFSIAGGSEDTRESLEKVRSLTDATLVLKRGALGAVVFDGPIPADLEQGVQVEGVRVDVLNVLGAGDAFMAGFLRGWLNEEGHAASLRYANASGALVVSRHGCTPAMPTQEELDFYLAHQQRIPRPDVDPQLNYLHRVTVQPEAPQELCIHAFDHRIQFEDMADAAGADHARIGELKQLLFAATLDVLDSDGLQDKGGILCDGIHGQDVLNAATGSRLWIGRPVEMPKSRPLRFEHDQDIGTLIASWPLQQIVKCLCFFSTQDSEELRRAQERTLLQLQNACFASGHEWLAEIIPPTDDPLPVGESVLASIRRCHELGLRPDWWKIPCIDRASAVAMGDFIATHTPHCRGIVVLGLDAPIEELGAGFKAFAGIDLVRGFAVGRSIFGEPSKRWLAGAIDDAQLQREIASRYRAVIAAWHQRGTA